MGESVRVPKLLTVKELAAATGIPVWRIHEWSAKRTGPPHIRIGKTLRFSEDAVVRWLDEQQAKTNQADTD